MSDTIKERIGEARELLASLGFGREQTNERSGMVLLALLGLRPTDPWTLAANPVVGTRAVIEWIAQHYAVTYAPNTRETVRRFTLHQFVDAGLVVENPDQPDRPVNSPKWCHQVNPRALEVVQSFGSPDFPGRLAGYLRLVPGLKQRYEALRAKRRLPVAMPFGAQVALSPGGQNILIKQMIEEFCPYYTPGGRVLYVGDADNKWAFFEEEHLAELGVRVDQHGKMPDLVVHLPDRNWLVLLEAAASHGPVDAKRHGELKKLFAASTAGLVFVSCFPSRAQMRKYLADIAWETEAWCADNPTHLIHFNGERFLGPYGEA